MYGKFKSCLICSADVIAKGNRRYCDAHAVNTEREREAVRKYQKANRARLTENRRRSDFKRNYGMTLAEVDSLIASQGHECAICGTKNPGGPGNRFMVDHDHETSKVRGALCCACNFILGYSRDNVEVLQKAIAYLQRSRNGG